MTSVVRCAAGLGFLRSPSGLLVLPADPASVGSR